MVFVLWIVMLLFGVIGIIHLSNIKAIQESYRAWGYPKGFHFVTGVLELVTVALLYRSETRLYGIVLGGLICIAAMGTLVWRKQYSHLIAPVILSVLLAALFYLH